MTATDPDLARGLSEFHPANTTPARSATAIILSVMLMFVDVELIVFGLRDHPVVLFVAVLGSPSVAVPLIRSTKHSR